jgi:hypothetical protein
LECTPLIDNDPEDEEVQYKTAEEGEQLFVVDVQEDIKIQVFQIIVSKIAEAEH